MAGVRGQPDGSEGTARLGAAVTRSANWHTRLAGPGQSRYGLSYWYGGPATMLGQAAPGGINRIILDKTDSSRDAPETQVVSGCLHVPDSAVV